MHTRNSEQSGFVGLIVLILVALIVLKFLYNFDIFNAASSPQGKETTDYAGQIIHTVWSYIQTPVTLVWNDVVWPLLSLWWKTFQAFLTWSNTAVSTPGH